MSHPRVYWTADRSALVEESDSRAAYLAYGEADTISPEHLALLGKKPGDHVKVKSGGAEHDYAVTAISRYADSLPAASH